MDRSREMKMAAAAGYGDDVQVRTMESIAQDPGDSNDSSNYFCESLIFSVFCGCSRVQNLQAPKGRLWTASKAFKLHANHGTIWAHLISSSTRSEGCVCVEIRACAMDPMQVFPAGRR